MPSHMKSMEAPAQKDAKPLCFLQFFACLYSIQVTDLALYIQLSYPGFLTMYAPLLQNQ
jgi:hypothetical protein